MKNNEYYNIKLNTLDGFFTDSRTSSFLKINDIESFGDLIDFSSTDKYNMLKKSNNELYREFEGSIKLIKYKFFGFDPKFNYESELNEFGFSTKAYLAIKYFKLMDEFNNFFEALQVFASEDILEILSYVHMVSPVTISEIREKCNIINEYHREKLNKCFDDNGVQRTR